MHLYIIISLLHGGKMNVMVLIRYNFHYFKVNINYVFI